MYNGDDSPKNLKIVMLPCCTLVFIIRRSKFYFTASGIVTPVGGRPVHKLRESSPNLCTGRPSNNLRTGRPLQSVTIPDAV